MAGAARIRLGQSRHSGDIHVPSKVCPHENPGFDLPLRVYFTVQSQVLPPAYVVALRALARESQGNAPGAMAIPA